MVQTNSAELVETSSKKAFKKLPNVAAAIKELTVLKAVGPATASGKIIPSPASATKTQAVKT